ncbi:MAG: MoxR family ATPase [Bacteroidales bacterium]|jgi:MoxR-like ATPase|nr:MoxR family ATPase [Bacteroidales bacterium]
MNELDVKLEQRSDYRDLSEKVSQIKAELAKVVVGQQHVIELLLTAILADGHALIEGPPGVAKTLIAKLLSKTIRAGFSRIQFTPDLLPSDVLGTSVFMPGSGKFEFKRGPVFSNIILIDEINRAPAKTQAALFEVMEERQVTVDGVTYKMDCPFIVLATQNPVEHEGTYSLPEAQLDRFLFKISITYPTADEEIRALNLHHNGIQAHIQEVNPVLDIATLQALRNSIVSQVHVEPRLMEYMVRITGQTRENRFIYLGASPRASIAILNGSKTLAAIRGRDFVTPEDIQTVAYPALRHRIILTPEKEMEGADADEIIRFIIQKIEVPR